MLGAPPSRPGGKSALALAVPVAALGLLLPLFGASLLAVLLLERLVLRRSHYASRWLGLGAA